MCIVFFKQNHGDFKLIIAGNRDENMERSTIDAHSWTMNSVDIIAGTDCSLDTQKSIHNGTWMGISTNSKFAFLTNNWETERKNAISRGYLVRDFLAGSTNPLQYVKNIEAQHMHYNGFNLVVGDIDGEMCYVTNRDDSGTVLQNGRSYCISNTTMSHINEWPKVQRGTKLFEIAIQNSDPKALQDALFAVLSDQSDIQGSPDDFVKYSICLNPLKYRGVNYATRTHTVILVDRNDRCYFCERDRDKSRPDRYFEFQL
jgi:uncharacterized protein with NRDE domain